MLKHYFGRYEPIAQEIWRSVSTISPKKCTSALFTAGVFSACNVQSSADLGVSQSTTSLLPDNEIIVTGVYQSQPQALSTQPIETLTNDDIKAIAPADTSTLLRNLRGLLVNQQGGMGGVSEVSIRGSESNFVSVFIDGVAVNDPVNSRGGSFNFNAISPTSIDKIEVLRGPNSTVYSSGALGGAIHLITLTANDTPEGSLTIDAGEQDYLNASIKLSGQSDSLGYGLRIGSLDSGSDMPDSRFQSDEIAGLISYQFSPDIYAQFNFRYVEDERESLPEQSGGPLYAINQTQELGDSEEWNGRFLLKADHNDWWQSQFEASYFDRQGSTQSPGIFPYNAVPATEDNTDYQRRHWRWTHTLGEQPQAPLIKSSKDNFWLNLGIERQQESGESEGFVDFGFALPTNFELKRHHVGGFANANYQSRNGWLWQVSARHDNPDTTSTQNAYQAGISSPVFDQQLQLSINWGQAYKLPSFFALAHPLVGNDQLAPELAEGWTLNVDWKLAEPLKTQLSVFVNDYQDLVDFDATLFKNVNRSSVESSGADISFQWQAQPSTRITANATYTDIDVKDNASKLTGRPQWTASARLEHRFNEAINAHFNYRWKDQQFATSLHTGIPVTEQLDSYGVLDMNIQWRLSEQLTTSFRLENVTDNDYQEAVGFIGQRRRARVGFALDF